MIDKLCEIYCSKDCKRNHPDDGSYTYFDCGQIELNEEGNKFWNEVLQRTKLRAQKKGAKGVSP